MPTTEATLYVTAQPFANGVDPVPSQGPSWYVTFDGSWQEGEWWSVQALDTALGTTRWGFGPATGERPVAVLTWRDRVYVATEHKVLFSVLGNPAVFNQPDAVGAGFVDVTGNFGAAEPLTALGLFQGKLAVFSRNTVQIWSVAADPAEFALEQVLQHVGTLAPASVQSIGELDVLFLHDTGVRSLRVRSESLNAFVVDIGTAVDPFVREALQGEGANRACAIFEPATSRYWLYLGGKLFVLSYYPTSRIVAWASYTPSYEVTESFAPNAMVVHNGRLLLRDDTLGLLEVTEEPAEVPVVVETPWLDIRTPATRKLLVGMDVLCEGEWELYVGSDFRSGELTFVGEVRGASTDLERLPVEIQGTHFKVRAVGFAQEKPAVLSSLVLHFLEADAT